LTIELIEKSRQHDRNPIGFEDEADAAVSIAALGLSANPDIAHCRLGVHAGIANACLIPDTFASMSCD
jgi:hypothetical protein